MPHLSMSVRYTIKDQPKKHHGYRGCSITYGRNREIPMHRMLMAVISDIVDHYGQFKDEEVLNTEIELLRQAIAGLSVTAQSGADTPSDP